MKNVKRLLLLSMVFLFGAISSYAYEQGDTIEVLTDRYMPIKIEAEWFDVNTSHKNGDPSTVPSTSTDGDVTYVNKMPNDMILNYNINVTGDGGTYKMVYTHKNLVGSGNIRLWYDNDYYGGGAGAAQRTLPADVTGEWNDFTHSVEMDLQPGKHTFGVRMNKSNTHTLDYFTLVPVSGKLTTVGAKATLSTPTVNAGMVKKTPDYDTSFVVGDVIEFTAVPDDNYYFKEWAEDLSGSVNPIMHTLDTTNKVKAVFYRTPDTLLLPNDRYTPMVFEAEAACKNWHRDHAVDSLTEIGVITSINMRTMREGKEVLYKIQHGGKIFFPIEVAGQGGDYRLNYSFFRNAVGGNAPGAFVFVDGVQVNNGQVVPLNGAEGDYSTTVNSAPFALTPGHHTIALKPNGGSSRFDLDKITLVPDSIAAVDAQVKVTANLGGVVAKTPDHGTNYVVGDSLTLEATPDFGFLFGSWSGDVESTDNPLKLKIDSAMNITANFVDDPDINNYKVTATAKDSGMVAITPALDEYVTGSDITLEATPKFGYFFKEWTGDVTGSENPVVIDSIAKDYVVEAVFEALPTYTLTLIDDQNTIVKSLELDEYPEGTSVVLTAGQSRTHRFAYWNDDMTSTDANLSVTIVSDTTISVNYEEKTEVVPGDYFYIDADAYVIDTIQAEWFNRDLSDEKWTGGESTQELVIDSIAGTDTVFVKRMGNGKNISYELMVGNEGGSYEITYYYRREVAGTNNVKVFLDGKQITSHYAEIAVPETAVGEWANVTCEYALEMEPGLHKLTFAAHYSDRHVFDYFTLYPIPGTIQVEGGLRMAYDDSRGTVSQTPYKLVYDKGEDLTLVAKPLDGFMFKEWRGDFTSTQDSVVIQMDSSVTAEAIFVPAYKVMIDSATINGTVSMTPQQDMYEGGDTVQFVPVPDAGYKFDGWYAEGGISGDTIPLTVVITNSFNLTAYFSQLSYRLAATAGDGGSVAKAPNRISYAAGTEVVLTATPDAGYVFKGWTGASTSTENPLTISMDSIIAIQATFELENSAINDVQEVAMDVYPNPSEALFTVAVDEAVTYAVYDLSGAKIIEGSADGEFVLDMSAFNTGIYTLQVETEGKSSVQRIMLK